MRLMHKRLLRTEPVAFGIWGTSMLGSIPDRDGTNPTVFVGTGKLSVRSRRVEILSWVPIRGSFGNVRAQPQAAVKLSKLGLILRHNNSAGTAQRWLEQRRQHPHSHSRYRASS